MAASVWIALNSGVRPPLSPGTFTVRFSALTMPVVTVPASPSGDPGHRVRRAADGRLGRAAAAEAGGRVEQAPAVTRATGDVPRRTARHERDGKRGTHRRHRGPALALAGHRGAEGVCRIAP